MKLEANTIQEYLEKVPKERQTAFRQLRDVILENLPNGFEEELSYGMIGYVVPHSVYPGGYHVAPELPLPFVNIASQKKFIAFYHMGIYVFPEIKNWFITEYSFQCKYKLDMGKSCVRLNHFDDIPYGLIGELISKISVEDWIKKYEVSRKG